LADLTELSMGLIGPGVKEITRIVGEATPTPP